MALQGNLDDFSLPEILQLIAVQQKSGVLRLTSGDEVVVIFFEGGKVVSTRDRRRNAKDPLKPFLVKTGRVTDAQMRQVETIEGESRRELTDILLSGNYLSSDQLTHALEEQIQDMLHHLLTWKTGAYHFSGDGRTVPKFGVNVRLNTEGLLMESMRRIDEFVRYRETLSSPAMVLRPKALAMPPKEMTAQEQRVLPLVDGLRPIRDILAQSKLVEFEVYEALHHLLDLQVVEVSLSAAPPKITPIAAEPPKKAPPRASGVVGVAMGTVAVAASVLIGMYLTPSLLSQVRQSSAAPTWAPAEIANVDDAARLTLALETYRSMRGGYPTDLATLRNEGFLPRDLARAVSERYIYQSDGVTYTRVER